MVNAKVQAELLDELSHLAPPLQTRVLEFAKSLRSGSPPTSWDERLAGLFGSLSKDEADAMMKVIEEDCEQIRPDEW